MVHSSTESEEVIHSHKILRPWLGIPVFYKVLIANSLIIFVGATGGTWLASNLHNSQQTLATPTSLILLLSPAGWLALCLILLCSRSLSARLWIWER